MLSLLKYLFVFVVNDVKLLLLLDRNELVVIWYVVFGLMIVLFSMIVELLIFDLVGVDVL